MEFQDFQAIRKEYEDQGISEHKLLDSPFAQLELWMEEANQNSPGSWFETNAMALATADSNGHVSVRYVLLKGVSDHELRFYTNYDSLKARQLADNPRCSVAFHWPFMGRQIRVTGNVAKTSKEDSERYFHSRPRNSQLGAVASKQSAVIESRQVLEEQMQSVESRFQNETIPIPENWGGYSIQPDHFEFWQGRSNRLHDRIVYQQSDSGSWTRHRLAP